MFSLAWEMIARSQSCRLGGPMSPLAHDDCLRGRFGGNASGAKTRPSAVTDERMAPPRRPQAVRRAIQASDEKNTVLARRYGVHRQTIAKWKARDTPFDARMGPKNPRSSVLTLEDEAIILAYRWRTRLSLE